jgi:hypothetical protein
MVSRFTEGGGISAQCIPRQHRSEYASNVRRTAHVGGSNVMILYHFYIGGIGNGRMVIQSKWAGAVISLW